MRALSWSRPVSSLARILTTFMTATPDRSGFYPPLWARRLFVFTFPVSYPLAVILFAGLMVLFIVETILGGVFDTMRELLDTVDDKE
jgi:hypothetical protein